MDYMDMDDIPIVPAIRGRISRTWRLICHGHKGRRQSQAQARRRNRHAYRQAMLTGETRHLPRPFGSWEIA
jgi:hypothetical protein